MCADVESRPLLELQVNILWIPARQRANCTRHAPAQEHVLRSVHGVLKRPQMRQQEADQSGSVEHNYQSWHNEGTRRFLLRQYQL